MSGDKAPKPGLALDDYIVALQKSFSRVASRSRSSEIADGSGDRARALIVGPVKFHVEAKVRLSTDGEHLLLDPQGSLLTFDGTIAPDQELVEPEEESTSTAPPTS